ncbi:molybdate ABC transporter substrate-binding protein, partial [Mesorhizobium sp. M7A.F.Ca.US.001.01.1.1]
MTRTGFGSRAIAIGGLAAALMAGVPAAHAGDKGGGVAAA